MFHARIADSEDLEIGLSQGGHASRWGQDVLRAWQRYSHHVPFVVLEGEHRVAFTWVAELNYSDGQVFTPLLHPAYSWHDMAPVLLDRVAAWGRKALLWRLRASLNTENSPWQVQLSVAGYLPLAYF